MRVYYPWSEAVLVGCLAAHDAGLMPTLDLELTSKCTQAACIYCDSAASLNSAISEELSETDTRNLILEASKLGLRWIYTCGLGEPLEDVRFQTLVETASSLGIRISLFTNGLLIDNETAKWLHANRVCLIVKLDSLDAGVFDRILGRKDAARRIYRAIDLLLEAGYAERNQDDCTDLAVSIVPTSLSLSDIGAVVRYARQHNIFPSVGELEQAGRVCERASYDGLSIDAAATQRLKNQVEELLWKDYTRPICPAIVTGLHVDNFGRCVVDRETGLNCKWFLLSEPDVHIIGDVRTHGLTGLLRTVSEYRFRCFSENADRIKFCESVEYTFGGCGGNPSRIIPLARQHLYSGPRRDRADSGAYGHPLAAG